MEKHECKICFKSFCNGRALGGHMRSHMKKLRLPSKAEESQSPPPTLLSFEAESVSSSSEDEEEDKGLSYVLRVNPKRSLRLVDPEISFVVDTNGSMILQDRESETESSKSPTWRRSKRAWKLGGLKDHYHHKKILQQETMKKLKSDEPSKTESGIVEPQPVSSISDATTEEDVAYCLMMLSRDKWKRQNDVEDQYDVVEEDEDEEEDDSDESEGAFESSKSRIRGKYACETCKKVFRSYQALGGHRASHKKIKVELEKKKKKKNNNNNNGGSSSSSMATHDKKIHECPFCFRVFSSGQALGGHKRTHLTGSSTTPIRASSEFVENLIDLNLPASIDEDDVSQIDNSGLSYAEFINPITQ